MRNYYLVLWKDKQLHYELDTHKTSYFDYINNKVTLRLPQNKHELERFIHKFIKTYDKLTDGEYLS